MKIGLLLSVAAIILAGLADWVAAQSPTIPPGKFKSSEVNDAVAAEEAAQVRAKMDYEKAIVAAKRKLIDVLMSAKDKATKAGDLDEAIKLRDRIASLKAEIDAITNTSATPSRTETRQPSPVGEWEVLNVNQNAKWILTLTSDGTAQKGKDAPGKWAMEKGILVVQLRRDLTLYFDRITTEEMKGNNSNKETITAARKKNP